MRQAGIEGVSRRRRLRTTRSDPTAARPADLVKRDFTANAPNQLWVTDLTYVATWSGVAYVCFIVDAFSRMIVGWRVASHMRTGMVLDALEMARWSRGTKLEGLVAHSDAGSQFTSVRYGERLAELGAQPSIGSVGDSYDNALAETVNGLYKTELIRGPGQGPWRPSRKSSSRRSAGCTGTTPNASTATSVTCHPIEFETAHYAAPAGHHRGSLKPNQRVSIKPRAIQRSGEPIPRLRATSGTFRPAHVRAPPRIARTTQTHRNTSVARAIPAVSLLPRPQGPGTSTHQTRGGSVPINPHAA